MRMRYCTSSTYAFQWTVAFGTTMILAIASYTQRALADDTVINIFTPLSRNLVELPDGSGTIIYRQTTTGTPLMAACVPAIVGMDEAAFRVGDPAYWAENHLRSPSLAIKDFPLTGGSGSNGRALHNSRMSALQALTDSAAETVGDGNPARQAVAPGPPLRKATAAVTTTVITRRILFIGPASHDSPVIHTGTTPVPVTASLHPASGRLPAPRGPATPQMAATSESMLAYAGKLARAFFPVSLIVISMVFIAKVVTWLGRG